MNRIVSTILPARLKVAATTIPLLFFCFSCSKFFRPLDVSSHLSLSMFPISDQVAVWKNPDSTETSFKKWVSALTLARPQLVSIAACANCDNDLLLLYDPGLPLFLQSQTVGSGSGTTNPQGPSGGNGPALFCPNFYLHIGDTSKYTYNPYLQPKPILLPDTPRFGSQFPPAFNTVGNNSVIVAVFDSGLEPEGISVVATARQSCLLPPATAPNASTLNGWNFIYNIQNTNDDLADLHGSKVTKMVIDQIRRYQGIDGVPATNVGILPVKIFGRDGKADFFHVLCGVAYAAGTGAKIINASFGFYHYSDPDHLAMAENLMRRYLRKYLGDNQMLMVAAAGNDDPVEDTLFVHQQGHTANDLRNLDINRFFPAYFANTEPNIISVTTVSRRLELPSPQQNTSKASVDVGVDCDTTVTGEYLFYDPLARYAFQNPGYVVQTINGSSFAAPVVTGRLAVLYGMLQSKTDKNIFLPQLIQVFPSLPPVLTIDHSFDTHIKGAKVAPK